MVRRLPSRWPFSGVWDGSLIRASALVLTRLRTILVILATFVPNVQGFLQFRFGFIEKSCHFLRLSNDLTTFIEESLVILATFVLNVVKS